LTCAGGYLKDGDVCVLDVVPQSSSHSNPSVPSSSSHPTPLPPASEDDGVNAGMIAGIVVGGVAAACIIGVIIYCVATSARKHSKMDPVIFDEDPDSDFVSMSVL